jgi:hypothetical protein
MFFVKKCNLDCGFRRLLTRAEHYPLLPDREYLLPPLNEASHGAVGPRVAGFRKQTQTSPPLKHTPLTLILTAGLHAASAQENQEAFLFEDGGQQRQFVVAADQNASIDAKGKTRIRSASADSELDRVSPQAGTKTAPTGEEPTLVLYEKGAVRNAFTRRIGLAPLFWTERAGCFWFSC